MNENHVEGKIRGNHEINQRARQAARQQQKMVQEGLQHTQDEPAAREDRKQFNFFAALVNSVLILFRVKGR